MKHILTTLIMMAVTVPAIAQESSPYEDLARVLNSREFREAVACNEPAVKNARSHSEITAELAALCATNNSQDPLKLVTDYLKKIERDVDRLRGEVRTNARSIDSLRNSSSSTPSYTPRRSPTPSRTIYKRVGSKVFYSKKEYDDWMQRRRDNRERG